MQSKKINELGTNVSPSVNDLTVVGDAATGQLKKITLNQIASLFGSVGGVSSVAMTVPTGLTVTGSPITTSGTLAVTLTAGYSIPTTAKQSEWDTGYAERLKWDGGASGLSAPTARTSLGLVIGTDVLAYRTFGSAANNNTGDFATAAQGTNADTAYTLRLTGASAPLSISGNVISLSQANTTTNGFLSSTDWNTFNGKQAALNGTGFVKATGTTISYDNSTYLTTSSASSTYLPLAGGTLTGALNGTTASFSSRITTTGGSNNGLLVTAFTGAITLPTTGLSLNTAYDVGYIANYNSSGTQADLYYQANSHTFNNPIKVVATGTIVRLGEESGTTGKQLLIGIDAATGRSELQSVWQGTGSTPLALQPVGGNLLLGTTTDNGAKLQVNGTATYSGNVGISGILNVRSSSATPSIWSGLYGGAITILGDNGTANRWIDISIVDSTGAISNQGLRVINGGNVLINTTSDNSQGKLQVNGAITATNISYTGEVVTGTTNLNATYYHIISTAASSGSTFTLPNPSSNNYQYVIINKTIFSQTVSAGSGFTIYDMAGNNSATISLAAKSRCYIIADGSSFYQIF